MGRQIIVDACGGQKSKGRQMLLRVLQSVSGVDIARKLGCSGEFVSLVASGLRKPQRWAIRVAFERHLNIPCESWDQPPERIDLGQSQASVSLPSWALDKVKAPPKPAAPKAPRNEHGELCSRGRELLLSLLRSATPNRVAKGVGCSSDAIRSIGLGRMSPRSYRAALEKAYGIPAAAWDEPSQQLINEPPKPAAPKAPRNERGELCSRGRELLLSLLQRDSVAKVAQGVGCSRRLVRLIAMGIESPRSFRAALEKAYGIPAAAWDEPPDQLEPIAVKQAG